MITAADFATDIAASGGSVVLPKPSNVADGDVLVASFAINGSTVSSPPSGWTLVAAATGVANPRLYCYYKVVSSAAGEPSSYTWTTGANGWGGGIRRYTGVDTSSVLTGTPTTNSGASGATLTATGITTDVNGAMLLAGFALNSSNVGNTMTIGSGQDLAEVWDLGGKRNEFDDGTQATAGATGNKTLTQSSNVAWEAYLAALRPAAGPQTVNVGQATETDAAQAVTRRKRRSVAQATETDTAQAVTRRKRRSVGQATETDAARVVTAILSVGPLIDRPARLTITLRAKAAPIRQRDEAAAISQRDEAATIRSDSASTAALAAREAAATVTDHAKRGELSEHERALTIGG